MPFANDLIYRKDREAFQLDAFDKRFPLANPNDCWTIDRDNGVFLRALRPHVGKSRSALASSPQDKDFHFHWKGYGFLIRAHLTAEAELMQRDGELFGALQERPSGPLPPLFYLSRIEEVEKPTPEAPSAFREHRQALFHDLREALAANSSGGRAYLSADEGSAGRTAIIKVAPDGMVEN